MGSYIALLYRNSLGAFLRSARGKSIRGMLGDPSARVFEVFLIVSQSFIVRISGVLVFPSGSGRSVGPGRLGVRIRVGVCALDFPHVKTIQEPCRNFDWCLSQPQLQHAVDFRLTRRLQAPALMYRSPSRSRGVAPLLGKY